MPRPPSPLGASSMLRPSGPPGVRHGYAAEITFRPVRWEQWTPAERADPDTVGAGRWQQLINDVYADMVSKPAMFARYPSHIKIYINGKKVPMHKMRAGGKE